MSSDLSCLATLNSLKEKYMRNDSAQPPPVLYDHVTQFRWNEAVHRCLTHPDEAKYQDPGSGITALHAACRTTTTPPIVVHALLRAYPNAAAMHTTHYASTPLHFACWRNLPVEIIQMLLSVFPMAASEENGLGLTPLHLAARTKNVFVVKVLLDTFPAAIQSSREAGYTPVHLAVRGASSVMRKEIRNQNREDITMDEEYEKGLSSAAAFSVIRTMVEKDRTVVRVKDQEGHTPIGLFCRSMESCVHYLLQQARASKDETSFLTNHPLLKDCWKTFLTLIRAASSDVWSEKPLHGVAGNKDCLESFPFTVLALKLHSNELEEFDDNGNCPIHVLGGQSDKPLQYTSRHPLDMYATELGPIMNAMDLFLIFHKESAFLLNRNGQLPLHVMLSPTGPKWLEGATSLVKANPAAVMKSDKESSLYPFMMAACAPRVKPIEDASTSDGAVTNNITTTFQLLRTCPEMARFEHESETQPRKRRRLR